MPGSSRVVWYMPIEPTPPSPHAAPPDWEAFGRFLSGESDAAEAVAIADWLGNHPEDERVIDALRQSTAQLAREVASPVDTERALAAVKARRADAAEHISSLDQARAARRDRTSTPRGSNGLPLTPAAFGVWPSLRAAAAIMIVATGLVIWRTQREGPPADTQIVVAPGARDSVQLPDGTRALLGPGSTLTYAADYGGATREVVLQGDGFFDVERDDAKPFTVRAGDAVIVDLGTAFTVRTDAIRGVAVAVTSGRVRLARLGAADQLELSAGDAGVLPSRGAPQHDSVSLDDALAWTTGALVFRDAAFRDVAVSLSRWYGVTVLADSSVQAARLTATFRNDARATVLKTLALSYGAGLDMRGDTAYFRVAGASRP